MINILLKVEKVIPQIASLLSGVIADQWPNLKDQFNSEAIVTYAEELRTQWLEHEWAEINLQASIQSPIQPLKLWRETFLFWIYTQNPKEKLTQPPFRCPTCQNLMMDKWACISCGYEVLSKKDHTLLENSSYDPRTLMPMNYLLLPDPKRRRVVVLDKEKYSQVVWQIQFQPNICNQPVTVALLPNQEFLIGDKKGRVFTCDAFGNVTWELDTQAHPVQSPSRVSYYYENGDIRYLVSDAGLHWVFVVNSEQELIWSHGTPGFPGCEANQLNAPHDIHYTYDGTYLITDSHNHRVIEIDPTKENKVIWQNKEKLFQPRFANRLLNHTTEVIDAGHFRILELDTSGELLDECVYYKDSMDMRVRVKEPLHYTRRQNTNVILLNGDRIIEVMRLHKQLVWYSLLTDLRLKHNIQQQSHRVPEKVKRVKEHPNWFRQEFNLQDVLQKVKVFEEAPPAFFNKLKSFLKFEEVTAGRVIVKEGDKGQAMYIIRKGHFDVFKGEDKLASLSAGDIFGEMSLVLSEIRSASVKAKENSQVYRLNKLAFETVIQSFPDILKNIKKMARRRLSMSQIKDRNKKHTKHEGSDRLKQLLEDQKKRFQALKNKRLIREQYTQVIKGEWNLVYTPLEQHVIKEAQVQSFSCYELHVTLAPHTQMKVARVALLVTVLEEHGSIIKTLPLPEDILNDKIDQSVSFSVLSQHSQDQVLHEIMAIVDVNDVKIEQIKI